MIQHIITSTASTFHKSSSYKKKSPTRVRNHVQLAQGPVCARDEFLSYQLLSTLKSPPGLLRTYTLYFKTVPWIFQCCFATMKWMLLLGQAIILALYRACLAPSLFRFTCWCSWLFPEVKLLLKDWSCSQKIHVLWGMQNEWVCGKIIPKWYSCCRWINKLLNNGLCSFSSQIFCT